MYMQRTHRLCGFTFISTYLLHDSAHRYTRGRGGPKNNRNLNVARELEVIARCAAKCSESTQYSSSLPRGVSLG
jgi:hypothetical protein